MWGIKTAIIILVVANDKLISISDILTRKLAKIKYSFKAVARFKGVFASNFQEIKEDMSV